MPTHYQNRILDKLRNSEKWPEFNRPEFLDKLNEMADESFEKGTVEGYLSATLIYHQLIEELMKILIDCSAFYIQLSIFPQEFKDRNYDNKMFGQLIKMLKESVVDNDIEGIMTRASQLNSLRIQMVHKLTAEPSLKEIKKKCKTAKKLYDSIYETFDKVHDVYRVTFSGFKKNIDDLEEMVTE